MYALPPHFLQYFYYDEYNFVMIMIKSFCALLSRSMLLFFLIKLFYEVAVKNLQKQQVALAL